VGSTRVRSLRQPRETFAHEATIAVAVPHDDSRISGAGVLSIAGWGFIMYCDRVTPAMAISRTAAAL